MTPHPEAVRAVATLREALVAERGLEQAHAAEALLRHGYGDGVETTILAKAAVAPVRLRVVLWRVLTQAASATGERARWEGLIRSAALDEDGPDRAHGLESWAKLALRGDGERLQAIADGGDGLAVYARWAVVAGGRRDQEAALIALVRSPIEPARSVAAYALMYEPCLLASTRSGLIEDSASLDEPGTPMWLLAALHAHADDPARWRTRLLAELQRPEPARRRMAATAFARRGDPAALAALVARREDEDADARIYAAEAVLRCLAALTGPRAGGAARG